MPKMRLHYFTKFVCIVLFFVILSVDSVEQNFNEGLAEAAKDPCKPNPCQNRGECKVNKEGNVTCVCKDPYMGPNCTLDFCNPNPCKNGGNCYKFSKKCSCSSKYTGEYCEKCKCENGFCKETGDEGNTVCVCHPGWGLQDTKCIRTCNQNPCLNGGTCKVVNNDIKCDCKDDFSGELCEKKETSDPCAKITCKNNGICRVDVGKAKCDCKDRFIGDLCEIDRCDPNPCENNGVCNVKKGKVECQCKDPYTGPNCTIENCKCKDGFCEKNEKGKLVCTCPPEWGPYTPTECTKCDCGKDSNCTYSGIFFVDKTCVCKVGYEDQDGFCKGTCKENPCLNGGTCTVVNDDIKCACIHDFSGELCEKKETSNPCAKIRCKNNSTCKVVDGQAKCDCKEGFTGDFCDIDRCKPNPCKYDGQCQVTKGEVSCICKDPYTGPNCTIDRCKPNPCKYGGQCQVTKGEVSCICKDPYTGPNCTINLCKPNPCQHNGKCQVNKGIVTCLCKEPYSGPNCTEELFTTVSSTVTTTTVSPSGPSSTENSTLEDTTTSPLKTTRSTVDTTTADSTSTISKGTTTPESNRTTSENGTTTPFSTTTHGNETEDNSTTSGTSTVSDANSTLSSTTMSSISSTASTSSISSSVSTEPNVTTTEVMPTGDGDNCKRNPCKNGGTCQQDKNGVKCLCAYPYSGKICTDSYWCIEGLGKTLCAEGKCTFDFKTKIGRCICQKGEYYDYNKKECKTIDKCPLTPDKCKGANEICEENDCRCIKNFKRNEKKECVPNFCESSEKVCGPTMTCLENPDDPENVKCVCKENEVFDGTQCLQVNKCHVPPFLGCQQICNATTQTCECYNGYTLQKDGKSCKSKAAESNCSIDCKPGTCYKDGERETCICPPTHVYEDGTCKVADLCKTSTIAQSLCPENACEPDPTLGFRCKCEGQLTYDASNVTCRRKVMCSEGGGDEICSKKYAKCVEDSNSKDGFRCDCAPEDEMETGTDGICKHKCDLKKNQDKCFEKGAVCEMDGSEAICKCPPMFTFSKDGRCEELASASYTGSLPFEKNKYSMKTFFAPGKASVVPDYDKMKHDLRDSMHLLYGSNYKFADILTCSNSTSSLICTVEVQFETEPKDQVKLITDCISDGSDSCFIPPQLLLSKKSGNLDLLVQTNPCTDMFKIPNCGGIQTVCKRLGKDNMNFECTCNKGFSSYKTIYPVRDRSTVIHQCQDIDECLEPTSCQESTVCKNTYGSYECWCKDGYRLQKANDDPKVTGCAPVCSIVKCVNGKCKASGSRYTCECNEGYSGESCEKKVQVAGYPKGMEVALITLSTIVIPVVLFSVYMIHKYRIATKKLNASGYLDDGSSSLSMQPLTPAR